MGLMNGTRLILREAGTRVSKCKIASGSHAGEIVRLPRIRLNLTESKKVLSDHPFAISSATSLCNDYK
eukprot:243784-Chlamydomonas_euryale.AAC.1